MDDRVNENEVIHFEDMVTDEPPPLIPAEPLVQDEPPSTENPEIRLIESQNKAPGQKYVRKLPDLVKPHIQEKLQDLDGSEVRVFKFIDDHGHLSDQSLYQFIDLEKRLVKMSRVNDKGKSKDVKLTAEEVAALKPGQRDALMRWPVKSGDDTVIYYPGVVGETRVLGVKEKEPDFEDSSFTEAEKDTLKKLLHGTFTKRHEFMAGVEAELQKQRRYGNFMSNGVTVSEEVQNRELPGIFDDILGRSKLSHHYADPDDDGTDEFVRKLVDLDFPNPYRAANDQFESSYGELIDREHKAWLGENYVMSADFAELKENASNPTLSVMKMYM